MKVGVDAEVRMTFSSSLFALFARKWRAAKWRAAFAGTCFTTSSLICEQSSSHSNFDSSTSGLCDRPLSDGEGPLSEPCELLPGEPENSVAISRLTALRTAGSFKS
jgi:hypothetical protein